MVTARPPFQKGDIVVAKDNPREIEVTGYDKDPEKESKLQGLKDAGEAEKVVNGFYVDDKAKAIHWWHENQLKFVRGFGG